MATRAQLKEQIGLATAEFNRLAGIYYQDKHISEKEFKQLEQYHDYVVQIHMMLEVSRDPIKNQAMLDDAYETAKKEEKSLLNIFDQLEKAPSNQLLGAYHIQHVNFKLAVNTVEEIDKWFKHRLYVNDLHRRLKSLKPLDKKIEQIRESLKIQAAAAEQSKLDADSIDQVDDIKSISVKFGKLYNSINNVHANIITHFVGWEKISRGICIDHRKAEIEYIHLMKSQQDETAKEAKLRQLSLNIALTFGNIIFPGLSTPVTTVLTKVLSPILDKQVTEYKDATVKIKGTVKNIKINTTTEKALAKEYIGHVSTILANFSDVASTLSLGTSKETSPSEFIPQNAADSLLKHSADLCEKIHDAAQKATWLLNICHDIDKRISNISTYKIFTDKKVDTSNFINSLKDLYKDLDAAVNALLKGRDKLSPPSTKGKAIFEQFMNVMLLKWLLTLETTKKVTVTKSMMTHTGFATVWYEKVIKDYPSLIAKDVQIAITKYCGISADAFKDIPYNTATDWTTWDSNSDKTIAALIKIAGTKLKSMESTNVWTSALGL